MESDGGSGGVLFLVITFINGLNQWLSSFLQVEFLRTHLRRRNVF